MGYDKKEVIMRKVIAALMLANACFTPAMAQTKTPAGTANSQAECQSNFKAADKNGNGMLTKAEIESSKMIVPTSLTSMESVSMSQFVTACSAKVGKGG